MGTGTGSIDLSTLNNLHTNLTQHFWFNSNTGVAYGTGVHITLSSQAEFIASPTGQNILMNTDGISIRNGTIPLMVLDNDSLDFNVITDLAQGTYSNVATFGATGFRMGAIADGETRLIANGGGIDLIRRDGTSDSVLAHFGYGLGESQSGTDIAPYYTFGTRESGSTVGNYSMAIGENITASGWRSYAEGFLTVASGGTSHAEGNRSVASGSESHAEGYKTTASSSYTHAEGYESAASGKYSHAEGVGTTSSGAQSHAEGSGTTSSGAYSHAEGYESTASGNYSHAQNRYTVANGEAQTAIGKYNQPNTTSAFIIGNGTSATALSNAFAVGWDGNVYAQGNFYARCASNSSGTAYIGQVFNWQGDLKSNLTANAGAYVEGNGSITLKGGHVYLVLAYVAMTNSTNGTVDRRAQIFNKTANTAVLAGDKFVASQAWGTVETQTIYEANEDVTLTVRGSASRPTTTIPTAWIRAVCIA